MSKKNEILNGYIAFVEQIGENQMLSYEKQLEYKQKQVADGSRSRKKPQKSMFVYGAFQSMR